MATTLIGSSMKINGEISSELDVVIEGSVKGRVITKGDLFISNDALVDAQIQTRNMEIAGHVNGNIEARREVAIAAGGRAVGDIKAQRFLIADGAIFKGNVDMEM